MVLKKRICWRLLNTVSNKCRKKNYGDNNMDKTKNIFVSHYHTDADSILKLKSLLDRHGLKMKDSSIYESKNPNNANNEEYIKSLIRPRIDWAGTTVVLIGKNTSKSDYVNWEIEHAASKGKRIVGVYLQGESDSEIPEALNKYGNSLQKWNGESIISGITGDNTWNGPGRNWATERVTC